MDRRIEKSKQAIVHAFMELMSKKDFKKITINEIAAEANINRGTVYSHFVDKFDLLNHCIETHLNELFENCISHGETSNFSSKSSLLLTFKYLEKNAFFYSNMLTNKGMPAFRERIHAITLRAVNDHIDMTGNNEGIDKEILVQYVTSAAVGVVEWWITNAMPFSAEYIVDHLWRLLDRDQMHNSDILY